jgi:uncharacterized protein YceH (UPF0502 family)
MCQYNPPVPLLTPNEVRVLGSLIEKQITTPEYYPLTLNSLTLACNQKNNRNPVTALTESEVEQALDSLRDKNLAYVFYGSTSRVPKFKHVAENLQLSPPEIAVMCVLMLSGAQTTGEIRGRAYRLYEVAGLEEIEQTLNALSTKDPEPLVTKLPRQAGQKEARFAHLLAGEVKTEELDGEHPVSKQTRRSVESEKVVSLEHRVETLAAEVEGLRRQFDEFKKQFE